MSERPVAVPMLAPVPVTGVAALTHTVEYLIGGTRRLLSGRLRAVVTCHGDERAECHHGCPRCAPDACDCELPDLPDPVDQGHCIAVAWWQGYGGASDGHEDFFESPQREVLAVAGLVEVVWSPTEPGWVWRYPAGTDYEVFELPDL